MGIEMTRALHGIACLFVGMALSSSVVGAEPTGKIKGSAGGIERGAIVFTRAGQLAGWTVTGPSGLYEFTGLAPGRYMMLIDGRIAPYVAVEAGRTTVVDQANQPKFSLEKEVWGPSRVRFAQSFVATGTAVTGFSLWRSSGDGKLLVSLYEGSPDGPRVAGPWETEKEMVWICWSHVPAEAFKTTPGKTYALELADAEGDTWNHSMPRLGDVYPHGIAYYDGVPHAESDLGIDIEQAHPGLVTIGAREDLHFIEEGPGSGTCRVAGQTFIAKSPNLLRAFANCGWGAGVKEFIFSIHEDGPGGKQVGPACRTRMVSDWGSDVLWFPDAVRLTPGQRYYLQYQRADGEPFFSYLSDNVYAEGRAYRDGQELPEQFDQLFSVVGEVEPDSVTYPYDVSASEITSRSALITWRSGTPADGLVHFGRTNHLVRTAGTEDTQDTEHRVKLSGLEPGTVYMYRASSHTHKASSRRTYSRIYSFLTLPGGPDEPRFDQPALPPPPPDCDECLELANGGFEDGIAGWSRHATTGRAKEPERHVPDAEPFGAAGPGVAGYTPHTGIGHYGWSYFGRTDPTWKEPREDWKRAMIHRRVPVTAGRTYELSAWLLTGDRGSGWGRDSRMRLAVDEADEGLLEQFDTVDEANVTQWFATHHQWHPVTLRFQARADHVVIGVHFLQWWALEANHLYVDEITVRLVTDNDR